MSSLISYGILFSLCSHSHAVIVDQTAVLVNNVDPKIKKGLSLIQLMTEISQPCIIE